MRVRVLRKAAYSVYAYEEKFEFKASFYLGAEITIKVAKYRFCLIWGFVIFLLVMVGC